jgi:oligosaccharyltransferase complex subunit alpha (ribophorin I)
MALRWLRLPLFVLGLVLPSIASFENTAIARSIDLGGTLVHSTTTYAVKALEDGSNVYVFALSEDEQKKSSWLEARVKGQTKPLSLGHHGLTKEYVV